MSLPLLDSTLWGDWSVESPMGVSYDLLSSGSVSHDCPNRTDGSLHFPISLLTGYLGCPLTAHVHRAHSDRARCVSTRAPKYPCLFHPLTLPQSSATVAPHARSVFHVEYGYKGRWYFRFCRTDVYVGR